MKILIILLATLFVMSGCLEGLSSASVETPTKDSENVGDGGESPNLVTKTVSVAVGRAGAILTSYDAFRTVDYSEQKLIPGQTYTDAYLASECSFGAYDPYTPDHDPHMIRGVAHGNNKFVAVGGCCHAVSRTSVDGITWSDEVKVDKAAVTYGSCPWAGDVAFGAGVFVSLGGGVSMWSSDGEAWNRIDWAAGSPPSGNFRRVEFQSGVFVGVGDGGRVATSLDGKNWQVEVAVSLSGKLSAGLGLILASDSTDPKIMKVFTAVTGTWSDGFTFAANIDSIYFSQQLNTFFVRSGGANHSSTDGLTWTSLGSSSREIHGYADDGFYHIGRSWGVTASYTRYVSIDGVTWQQIEQVSFNPLIDFITSEIQVPE